MLRNLRKTPDLTFAIIAHTIFISEGTLEAIFLRLLKNIKY